MIYVAAAGLYAPDLSSVHPDYHEHNAYYQLKHIIWRRWGLFAVIVGIRGSMLSGDQRLGTSRQLPDTTIGRASGPCAIFNDL